MTTISNCCGSRILELGNDESKICLGCGEHCDCDDDDFDLDLDVPYWEDED